MLQKRPRCSAADCRNRATASGFCDAHEALAACDRLVAEAEQRGFLNGVRAASDDVHALANRWGAVPRHVLVQAARSWLEEHPEETP